MTPVKQVEKMLGILLEWKTGERKFKSNTVINYSARRGEFLIKVTPRWVIDIGTEWQIQLYQIFKSELILLRAYSSAKSLSKAKIRAEGILIRRAKKFRQ